MLLIRKENKDKLDWQNGRWNGVGGKIEPEDNSPLEAMQREGIEETGMRLNWDHCLTFDCSGGTVFVYKAIDNLNCGHENFCDGIHYKQIESELLKIWPIDNMPDKVLNNLRWLIPLCLSELQFPILMQYKIDQRAIQERD